MGRLTRSERLALKGRPKRRAAKTHFFKYQLASNPSRAEENDLKRALQESLEEHGGKNGSNNVASSINSSDVSRSNNSSSSNESARSTKSSNQKRSIHQPIVNTPVTKRAKCSATNGYQNKCDDHSSEVLVESTSTSTLVLPQNNNNNGNNSRAIRTYSRSQPELSVQNLKDHSKMKTSTPIIRPTFETHDNETLSKDSIISSSSVSRSTQTPNVSAKFGLIPTIKTNNIVSTAAKTSPIDSIASSNNGTDNKLQNPDVNNQTPFQYLKFKRESKNYAYVKMSALNVSTSKSPSNSKSSNSRKSSSPNGILHNNSTNKESAKISTKTCASPNLHSDSTLTSECSSATKAADKGNYVKTNTSKNDIKSLKSGKKSPTTTISSKSSPQNGISHNGPSNNNGKATTNSVATVSHLQRNNIPRNGSDTNADSQGQNNDCSLIDTQDLSKKMNQSQAQVKITKKRVPQGSWSLLGVPEERVILLRDDEPPKRLICYPAIKHVEGDVIQVKDSVLLRSGARKTDLPYIAKVCAFWEDAETGGVMMSLFWYYRPEHTEEGRKPHHLTDEIFASRHRDVDSVECIDDKCYVLTFNEYCRYRKRCKMEQVGTNWSLTDVTIPVSNESYPRRNRIPDSDVNPELVFCCRQIYDSRMRRLVKNPLINPKYGHI